MNVEIGDLLTIERKKYVVLEILLYNNEKYAFVNMMTEEEEATDQYFIFKLIDEDNVRFVLDEELKQALLPQFEELLKKDIEKLVQE